MYASIVDTNLLLLLITLLGNALALIWHARLERDLNETAGQIHRSAVHQRELAQLMETHDQLHELQNLTESAVQSGTATIRSLHREIANIPFEILESLPATREGSRIVRGVHDLTADGVYDSITRINKRMGERLRRQFKLNPDDKQNDENL